MRVRDTRGREGCALGGPHAGRPEGKRPTLGRLLLLACATAFLTAAQDGSKPKPVTQSLRSSGAADTVTSYATALYGLARQYFVAHKGRGETWVLSVHEVGPDIVKYREGSYVVASVHTLEFDREGLCLFAEHYNGLTLGQADELALNGDPAAALKIYRLLMRFARCSSPDALGKRILAAEKMDQGLDTESNRATIRSLRQESGAVPIESLESCPAIITTNLLDVVLLPR